MLEQATDAPLLTSDVVSALQAITRTIETEGKASLSGDYGWPGGGVPVIIIRVRTTGK